MLKALEMAHQWLEEIIEPEDLVVDATVGNGHDTVFLAGLSVCPEVLGFDIQEAAIKRTQERLNELNLESNVILINEGHENLAYYVEREVKAAIFNLGYLPNSDKSIITKPETTLTALSALTERLVGGGRIAIMIYYGHEGGMREKNEVINWASQLNQKFWEVMTYAPLNQVHTPPILVVLEKKRAE